VTGLQYNQLSITLPDKRVANVQQIWSKNHVNETDTLSAELEAARAEISALRAIIATDAEDAEKVVTGLARLADADPAALYRAATDERGVKLEEHSPETDAANWRPATDGTLLAAYNVQLEAVNGYPDCRPESKTQTCEWRYDEYSCDYDTDCGNTFVMIDGTPQDNGMIYCAYCGKPIVVGKPMFEEEPEDGP
jgi:hypothetical protein